MDRIRIELRDGEYTIVLPADFVRLWRVKEGDTLDALEATGGLYLTPSAAGRPTEAELIERIVRENQEVLRRLAQ
jgi:hypothetical protein